MIHLSHTILNWFRCQGLFCDSFTTKNDTDPTVELHSRTQPGQSQNPPHVSIRTACDKWHHKKANRLSAVDSNQYFSYYDIAFAHDAG